MICKKSWVIKEAKIDAFMESIMSELFFCLPEEKQAIGVLIFEEVYTNIVKYAYLENESVDKYVRIHFYIENENRCVFVFSDYGCEFDLTEYQPAEPDGNQIGGHGIRMIKQMSKKIKYKRIHNKKNHLAIAF